MAERKKVTTEDFRRKKAAGEKIAMITAYDYAGARLADEAGVDSILVGDSLGMVVLGYDSTVPVTMEEMLHHTRAAMRGTKRALLIGDMPFLSYQASTEEALRNAGRFLQEAGAMAVKLEGGRAYAPTVRRLVRAGIPVVGHLGLTPQSIHQFGSYRLRAGEASSAVTLVEDALALAEAGAFAIVLEKIPWEVAAAVTRLSPVPTIGIGSGSECDGQVLVFHDLLGILDDFQYKFVKRFAAVGETIRGSVARYVEEVTEGRFPTEEHAWRMDPSELDSFHGELERRGWGA